MKLEIGGCYLDREGRLIGPLVSPKHYSAQGFNFKHDRKCYRADGSYRVKGGQRIDRRGRPAPDWSNRFDLVARAHVKP